MDSPPRTERDPHSTTLPDLSELARRDAKDGIAQHVVGAVIEYSGKVLLLKRPADDFRGGSWELPSGKVEPADTDLIAALRREVSEENGLAVSEVTGYLGTFDYVSGSGKHTRQHTWSVAVTGTVEVRLTEHDEAAWVTDTTEHPVSDEVRHLIDTHLVTING